MISVEDRQIAWQPGMTLEKVINRLEHGHLFAVVRLNGKLVSKPDFSSCLVPDDAVIIPLPLIAGG